MGTATSPVNHMGYLWRQANPRAYGHHTLEPGTPPGVYMCGVCGRLVVRGLGSATPRDLPTLVGLFKGCAA